MAPFLTLGSRPGRETPAHEVPAVDRDRAATRAPQLTDSGPADRALDAPVEGALRRGHHDRAVHGLRRLRDRLPARRPRLRPRDGRLQAVPPRGRARPRRLHPRREGLHVAAPGPARGSARGSPRPTSTCSAAMREPDEMSGIYQGHRAGRASDDMVHEIGPGRRARVGPADLGAGRGLHRRRARRRTSKATARRWKADPGRRHATRKRSSRRPAAATRTRRTRSPSTRRSSEGFSKLALVGMSCQSSVPPVM